MEPRLIGLSGKKLSGKDTVYQLAAGLLDDWNVGRIAFADAVKHEVSKITGYRVDFIEENKKLFRPLLQVWGTDFRRQFNGVNYWIEKMSEAIEDAGKHYDLLFITDIRFRNEADYVKEQGGKLVRIERRTQSYENIQDAVHDDHSSEIAMNDYSEYDYVLNNDGTESDLTEAISSMLETLKIKNAA